MTQTRFDPDDILAFWFPDTGHEKSPQTHAAFWDERMQGGMDAAIIDRFAGVTLAAAKGELDHWADTPRGRLALLIALDQFSRSLWRDTPAAFGQDIKSVRLVEDGIRCGHFSGLKPWEQTFYVIAIGHCEGPDHLERMERHWATVETIVENLPNQLAPIGEMLCAQHKRVMGVLAQFGRHPHRNAVLGRPSTHAEEAYIAAGDFPHIRKVTVSAAAS